VAYQEAIEMIRRGQVLSIPEAHYCYGTGVLTIRVTEVCDEIHLNLEWLRIQGVEILWNGADGPSRDVLVRVAALRSPRTVTTEQPRHAPND
jgi:hypothetical protein